MAVAFPKAVVFDWDNTLVDSWPAIMDAINQTRIKFGLEAWNYSEIMANCTRAARDSFPDWFGPDKWKDAYAFYYDAFDQVRRTRDIKVKAGALELLQWLKANKIPAYVVSNKRGDYLRHEVERLGWQDMFAGVAGAQDAPKDKPSREHVDHVLVPHNIVSDAEVWFVGDSEADIQCAINANCTPVFIGSPEDGKKHGAELIFPDCCALGDLLYNLPKQ